MDKLRDEKYDVTPTTVMIVYRKFVIILNVEYGEFMAKVV